jgi:hypothetical protein
MYIDSDTYSLITSAIATIFFLVMAYLRTKYAAFGDKLLNELGQILAASKADEVLFPSLAPENAKLETAYNDLTTLWNTNDFASWADLIKLADDFFNVYEGIRQIKNTLVAGGNATAPVASTSSPASTASKLTLTA